MTDKITRFKQSKLPETSQATIGAKKDRKKPVAPAVDFFCRICKAALQVDVVREFKFHPSRKWRYDYAIPEHKIAIEVEGGVWTEGRHVRPAGFLKDMDKYNAGAVMGWRIFRVTPHTLLNTATLEMIRQAVNTIKVF